MKATVVVPWHKQSQRDLFMDQWGVSLSDHRVLFQQDSSRQGCALTKNAGIKRAIEEGAEVVIVLDDDCFPDQGQTLDAFIVSHIDALRPQPVQMFDAVSDPPSRGTPYFNRTIKMPVAASMGFWSEVGDYDAPSQLVRGAQCPMTFDKSPRFGRYFPLCGMNIAFRATEWPWCQFIDVPRFDDIWAGFLWQKKAYASGQCFNLGGPVVRHSRQSDVWENLRCEALNMERNETMWQSIHSLNLESYQTMIDNLQCQFALRG